MRASSARARSGATSAAAALNEGLISALRNADLRLMQIDGQNLSDTAATSQAKFVPT
jgi:hypothetical protein